MANGQPRPAFYVAVLLVVIGLVGLALWRYGAIGSGVPVTGAGAPTRSPLEPWSAGTGRGVVAIRPRAAW